MSNRFTEKAEKALNGAKTEAEMLGHTYIGSEHIVLSLANDKTSGASAVLEKCGTSYEKIKNTVKEYSGIGTKSSLTPKDMTPRARKIVENSYKISLRYGAGKIGTEHILLSVIEEKESVALKILVLSGIDTVNLTDEIITLLRSAEKNFESGYERKNVTEPALTQYGRNLTKEAASGFKDPIIGREKETERLIRILCRKSKNNPCLIGEAGVGKTAIVEGLAQRISTGNVPMCLRGKSIISVDLTSMVAGAKYRGDFEERIKNMINEASKNKSIILFIDEIHTIVGAGSAEGAIDAANILKPQLSRAEIQVIGATTFEEYHKYIKKDAALDRRFQSLNVEEPSHEETVNILMGLKDRYEKHHGVVISENAIKDAVTLSERYIQERYLPDKALDILDEACAKVNIINATKTVFNSRQNDLKTASKMQTHSFEPVGNITDICFDDSKLCEVGEREVKEIVNEITGIPICGMSERTSYDKIRKTLLDKIIGQDDVVDKLSMSVVRSESGITNNERPKGIFLFAGPSGVGKTAMAKALASAMFFDETSFIKYDMSEFSEKNSVTKLIGSPPGYIGYEKGGLLTEKIRRRPYSLLLFDEIEKANDEVINIFLQIMDEGVLTDSLGRRASFKNSYIIFTSNLCSSSDEEKVIGFTKERPDEIKLEKLKKRFPAEFLNRIDLILPFYSLDLSSMRKITEMKMNSLLARLEELSFELKYDDDVLEYLSTKAFSARMGVRGIERLILNEVENLISLKIANMHSAEWRLCLSETGDSLLLIQNDFMAKRKVLQ